MDFLVSYFDIDGVPVLLAYIYKTEGLNSLGEVELDAVAKIGLADEWFDVEIKQVDLHAELSDKGVQIMYDKETVFCNHVSINWQKLWDGGYEYGV